MLLGDYRLDPLLLSKFRLDGGATFGIVPRKLWMRAYPYADSDGRIDLASYGYLLRGHGRTILIDSGIGTKLDLRSEEIFDLRHQVPTIEDALAVHGVAADDVTDVLLTHLHFDHSGGCTRRLDDGTIVPVFPRARHYVQQDHLAWARNPSDKDRASFLPENWESLRERELLATLDGEGEVFPGVHLRLAHGHTKAMQMVAIHSSSADSPGCLLSIDLFVTAAHLPPHYVPALDNHPLITLEEKRKYAAEVYERNWVLVFGHDPFTHAARLQPGKRGFEIAEVVDLAAGERSPSNVNMLEL